MDIIGPKLAPYNPTNIDAVNIALDLLNISSIDTLYDLGCGDGRLLVEALQRLQGNIRCVGIEYDKNLCDKAIDNLSKQNLLTDKISILHANVLDVSITDATAVFVYLVPEGMRAMRETLLHIISNGGRIVTYVFSIPDVQPSQVVIYKQSTKLYLYCNEREREG
mmetsp:Transcript_20545/g.20655  ORF Transcript_20545/g.20655 Transcript_20545/m.20655 type:complete len:165 (+) Transcript_20545:103-597(+)